MGKSGSYRQTVFNRQSLKKAQEHEERRDVSGRARSVQKVAPLIWSDGQISEPENWCPGNWDSNLVADYERHVEGARRDKRSIASGKLGVQAFLQFPTDFETTPENERLMLAQAVDFVNKIHGGDAVFHARLDRDEAGKHGVDVFFAPKFEKKTGRNKEKSETWISLTKFEKEEAAKRGLKDAGPRSRGRMFQDAWAEHLQKEMGLEWVQRGEKKKYLAPDRLSPEEFKIKKEKQKIEDIKKELEMERIRLKFEFDNNNSFEKNLMDRSKNLSKTEDDLKNQLEILKENDKKAQKQEFYLRKQREREAREIETRKKHEEVSDLVTREMFAGNVLEIERKDGRICAKFGDEFSSNSVLRNSFFEKISDFVDVAIETALRWRKIFDALNIEAINLPKVLEKVAPLVNKKTNKAPRGPDGVDF